jgi:hypothetical protein
MQSTEKMEAEYSKLGVDCYGVDSFEVDEHGQKNPKFFLVKANAFRNCPCASISVVGLETYLTKHNLARDQETRNGMDILQALECYVSEATLSPRVLDPKEAQNLVRIAESVSGFLAVVGPKQSAKEEKQMYEFLVRRFYGLEQAFNTLATAQPGVTARPGFESAHQSYPERGLSAVLQRSIEKVPWPTRPTAYSPNCKCRIKIKGDGFPIEASALSMERDCEGALEWCRKNLNGNEPCEIDAASPGCPPAP